MSKFTPGQRVTVFPTSTEYEHYIGQSAVIVYELGDDERDPEVGPMYEVKFEDGSSLHTFEDELHV